MNWEKGWNYQQDRKRKKSVDMGGEKGTQGRMMKKGKQDIN